MSLVDYASSDDDGGDADMSDKERDKTDASAPTRSFNQMSQSVSHEQPGGTLHSLTPSFEELPDASLLLNSPDIPSHLASCSDHSSRVAAAMAENASRKRKSRILASSLTRSKVPRGTLPHSKKDPETAGGVLLPPQLKGRMSPSVSHEQPGGTLHSLMPSFEELPNASLLLNSPDIPSHLASCSDHSSRVAVAMAENASRKRKSRILASSLTRSEVPRGTLPHSKKDQETASGVLLPPQLKGRSNVVTEDISKLFVKGRANPSSA